MDEQTLTALREDELTERRRRSMAIVLARDPAGCPVLWQCYICGQPFTLGWGWCCNKCIREEERHRELIHSIQAKRKAPNHD